MRDSTRPHKHSDVFHRCNNFGTFPFLAGVPAGNKVYFTSSLMASDSNTTRNDQNLHCVLWNCTSDFFAVEFGMLSERMRTSRTTAARLCVVFHSEASFPSVKLVNGTIAPLARQEEKHTRSVMQGFFAPMLPSRANAIFFAAAMALLGQHIHSAISGVQHMHVHTV